MIGETDSDSEPEGGVNRRYNNVCLCPVPPLPPPTPDIPSRERRQTSSRPLLDLGLAGSPSFNGIFLFFNRNILKAMFLLISNCLVVPLT